MRKIILIFISFVVIFGGTVSLADLAGYTIKDYIVSMELNEDGSMDVKESIDVNFDEYRHGIYRAIPYYSPSGRYTIIENFMAEWDTATYYTENDAYNLRIWDANKTIIWDHTYIVKYRVKNAIWVFNSWGESWTELYRNIIGTDRATTIDRVSFSITLPKSQTFGSGDYFLKYGKAGEKKTENSQISVQQSGLVVVGNIYTRLWNNESVTVGLKFPADYFNLSKEYLAIKWPSLVAKIWLWCKNFFFSILGFNINSFYSLWFVIYIALIVFLLIVLYTFVKIKKQPEGKNNHIVVGILLIAILVWILKFLPISIKNLTIEGVFGIMLITILSIMILSLLWTELSYNKKTKGYHSKKPGTIYYNPPKNIDIAVASQLYGGFSDIRTLAALLYFWASKWYITIDTRKKRIVFSFYTQYILHYKNLTTGINAILIRRIFSAQNTLNLSNLEYKCFSAYKDALIEHWKSAIAQYYSIEDKKLFWLIPYSIESLNQKGIQICEEIRGFKFFLKHVEEPRIRIMLKENPNYIDEVLPRAVLFGVETEFLKVVSRIVGELKNPDWYSGEAPFSDSTIHSMVYSFSNAMISPRSDSWSSGYDTWGWGWWSSGFSWWWGSSGGGWGGWGGGSW